MPTEDYWPGEKDCLHYQGVQKVVIKTCCGGRRKERVRIGCVVHRKTFAEVCREGVCWNYERGERDA